MDPNATLRQLLIALQQGDAECAAQSAIDLARWLDKGGAFPAILSLHVEPPLGTVHLVLPRP